MHLTFPEKVEELVPCCIRSLKSNCTTVLVSFNQSKNVSGSDLLSPLTTRTKIRDDSDDDSFTLTNNTLVVR